MLKKVIRWTPFVSIALLVLMFVGMTQARCHTEGVYNYCDGEAWTSDANSFSIGEVLSLFGHVNGMHLLANALMLLLFAVPAELLLGRRKFIASLLLAMIVQIICDEIVNTNSLGSSGWLMAMPGLMFGASMWKIHKEGETSGFMGLPILGFVLGGIGNFVSDVTSTGNDGVGHTAHIIGFVSGLVFVIAGIPFLAMTIRDDIRAWRRKRAWRARRAFI
jgi:membrane associated rhomboid family serine protease